MIIKINGNIKTIENSMSLTNLLDKFHDPSIKMAVEINGILVIKSEYDSYLIKENDEIEIVHAIGGG